MFIVKTIKIAIAFAISCASLNAMAQAQPPSASASPFEGYRKYSEKNPPTDWRGTNTLVEKLDGHMGHVRGAPRAMEPARATTKAPEMEKKAPAPNAVDHKNHEMKKP